MNRLWVRLSLVYTGVMCFVVLLLLIMFLILPDDEPQNVNDFDNSPLTSEQIEALTVLRRTGLTEEIVQRLFSAQLILFSMVTIIFGVLGSILLSYRMTRPLAALEAAATKVGQRDLSYRVEASGTDEMVALANAFNGMAGELESAEIRRQNLLADVSHELRTPLTVLQGNLRAALDNITVLDLPQIAKLYDHTRQLNHLITDLHDLAQAEANRLSLNIETVNLSHLVTQAGELFTPLAKDHNIDIDINVPETLYVAGDQARLMQVLQNLIANAIRYAKSNIQLTLSTTNEMIILSIVDDGSGIEPAHLAHIFDRFYRVDNSRTRQTGGTGLGLTIVKSLVEGHGGTISATSAIGHGTTMTLSFPV
ncbi:MAG: sensor histidine kinase [Candidatus Promineifilaceae bacterium]